MNDKQRAGIIVGALLRSNRNSAQLIDEIARLWLQECVADINNTEIYVTSYAEMPEAVNKEEVLKRARDNYEMLSNTLKNLIFERMENIPFNIRSDVVARLDTEIEFED